MADKKERKENIMDDEKELDMIFEDSKKGKLDKAIKRAKRRSIIRSTIVSLIALGVLMGGSIFVGNKIMDKERGIIQSALNDFNNISAPNEYIGRAIRNEETFGGTTLYTTYKIVEGKVVYSGQQEYNYGILKSSETQGIELPEITGAMRTEDDLKKTKYNELGQRQMVFFYPFIDYRFYKNDLNLLEDIGENKYIEMALSFNQAYSIDDVNKMMPKDITIAWYWVDDLNDSEKEFLKSENEKQIDAEGKTITEYIPARLLPVSEAYGIKNYDESGELIENPELLFINSLESGNKERDKIKGSSYRAVKYKEEFRRVYDNIAGIDGTLTKEDIKVQGVVVTGDMETLMTLRGLPFVNASSLGVATDKY